MGGDVIATIFMLVYIIVLVVLIGIVFSVYKKNKGRAEEQSNIAQQQTINLQKQVDDLNERVSKIESLLKKND